MSRLLFLFLSILAIAATVSGVEVCSRDSQLNTCAGGRWCRSVTGTFVCLDRKLYKLDPSEGLSIPIGSIMPGNWDCNGITSGAHGMFTWSTAPESQATILRLNPLSGSVMETHRIQSMDARASGSLAALDVTSMSGTPRYAYGVVRSNASPMGSGQFLSIVAIDLDGDTSRTLRMLPIDVDPTVLSASLLVAHGTVFISIVNMRDGHAVIHHLSEHDLMKGQDEPIIDKPFKMQTACGEGKSAKVKRLDLGYDFARNQTFALETCFHGAARYVDLVFSDGGKTLHLHPDSKPIIGRTRLESQLTIRGTSAWSTDNWCL